MAGRFDEAVEHYHASLKLEPNFGESLLGLADTYALMGREDDARAQYEVAIQHAYTRAYAVQWKLKWAATYLREKRFSDADAAFQSAAKMAHESSVGGLEAEAYRTMALYQTDEAAAARWLQKAKESLDHPHDTSQTARQQQLALIYRTSIYRAVQRGRMLEAEKTLEQLSKIASASHNPGIDVAFHASAGTVLMAKRKWLEAIPHLEEDANDPYSMELLVNAYQYACGTWKKNNPVPSDQVFWARYNQLGEYNREVLRKIMEQAGSTPAGSQTARIVGNFYTSCMDETAANRAGITPLQSELRRIAAVSSRKELIDAVAHLHSIGVPVLFEFGAQPELHDATRMGAVIVQGGLGLPDRDYYLNQNDNSKQIRSKYV